jgi:enamine deaminase RidA (YjgF/YER057c/UK114 family)
VGKYPTPSTEPQKHPTHGAKPPVRLRHWTLDVECPVPPLQNLAKMNVEQRLEELGLTLPPPPKAAGNYEPWVRHGHLLFISAQLPIENGKPIYTGRVGAERTEEEGCAAARLAALNVLAQIRAALGGFESLATLLRVEGHVAAAPDWNRVPKVLDGASDLFAAVLGERGRHARSAFCPPRLPLDLTVELVVTAAVREG